MIKLFLLLIRVLIMISKQAEQNTAVASIRPSVRWSQPPIGLFLRVLWSNR